MTRLVFPVVFVVLILSASGFWWLKSKNSVLPQPSVTSFETCVAAGNPVMESYPPACRTKTGSVFILDIGNELELHDLIIATSPRPNQAITSPLSVSGQARGSWYFEGSFPVSLIDENNQVLATTTAKAEGEWMTTEFVPFSTNLTFQVPSSTKGKLVLKKDNPSGLPQNDKELIIPVTFH